MNNRIRLLDIFRGFAILGTLGTNIWLFAELGSIATIYPDPAVSWWTSFNSILKTFILLLVNGKFLGILTIMFGIGLELKRRKAQRLGQKWPGLYLWSSFLLLLDGALHYFLVMDYDILMSYAVTAMIVAFIVNRSDRVIRRVMIGVGSFHLFLISLILVVLMNAHVTYDGAFTEITELYRSGSWLEQIRYRYDSFWANRLESIMIIPMNVFLFLTGVLLIRSGALAPDEKGKAIRRTMLRWGLGVGLPLNLLIFVPGSLFAIPVRYVFAPVLSLGYMALIAKIMEKDKADWLWRRFEEIGKTALSCYVLQNIIASFIFYGWGLGLGGTYGAFFTLLIWILISGLLMFVSHLWLRRFASGPVEWLWRWLSDMPVRKT
ncbi:DUF418 domain-containing protein [Paenibacillus sp. FJAT-26967]|uniref:DUF418 domain-containing protein n=1 Tax=Paenibacillus sp. FJAT-26967 TaxID=1729690 RepID=UPI0008384891|nr:DUF418 domain-containing protein [Paenibacillus sp. FJAT-26967]